MKVHSLSARLWCAVATMAFMSSSHFSVAKASTISITDNPVSVNGIIGTDYLLYKQVGATLINDNAVTVASVLSGPKSQTAPGGNIRLYAGSNSADLTTFATATHINLSGTLGSHSVSLGSLNGADWFTTTGNTYDTSYGAANLANKWFNDFMTAYSFDAVLGLAGYNNSQIALEKQGLYTNFLNNPVANGAGFQHLSGTSISYVQADTTTNLMSVGLADTDGFLFPLIKAYVTATAPNVLPFLPADVYASKAVMVSVDGSTPRALYSFSSVPSGLATTDGTHSYDLEFQATTSVPEPTGIGLITLSGLGLLKRRGQKCTRVDSNH